MLRLPNTVHATPETTMDELSSSTDEESIANARICQSQSLKSVMDIVQGIVSVSGNHADKCYKLSHYRLVSGHTVLGKCVAIGKTELVRYLLEFLEENIQSSSDESTTGAGASSSSGVRFSSVSTAINIYDAYDRTALHYAAQLMDPTILKMLVQYGGNVNVWDSTSFTPLHLAVTRNAMEAVKTLIEAGARINAKTTDRQTPLHLACSYGHTNVARVLLEAGAKIDTLDASERTPLILACQRGHTELARVLVQHGANVNLRDVHGEYPVAIATWSNNMPLVDLLLSVPTCRVSNGDNLLHSAISTHNVALLKRLLSLGRMAVNGRRSGTSRTPLLEAVAEQQIDMARLLIQHGADVNVHNALTGESVLHVLIATLPHPSQLKLFRDFLRLFLDGGLKLNRCEAFPGHTPLFAAVVMEKWAFAEALILGGCDPSAGHAYTCHAQNTLYLARAHNPAFARLLVESGCHVPSSQPMSGEDVLPSPPLSLASYCRIAIRRHLRSDRDDVIGSGFKLADGRTLPTFLRRFLRFEDLLQYPHFS